MKPVARPALAAALATLGLFASVSAQAAASEASVQAHLDAAKRAARDDLGGFLGLCRPASVTRPTVGDADLARLIATPGPGPGKAFDNLFYLGSGWVSAWALKTSDGLVLIDALNTAEEADKLIVDGLKQLGLGNEPIRTIIVTHGHGDHYGGARRLQALAPASAKPRIVMSQLDWTMTQTQLEFASPLWPEPPRRDPAIDLSTQDGDVLRQGGSALTLYITPGHTMGTISPVFDVQWGGKTYRAMIWGGTGFNFGRDFPRMDAYIASTERMREIVQQQRIEVLLSNHPGNDGTATRIPALRAAGGSATANPYVVGTETVLRALTVAGECARANRDRFEMLP